MATSVKFYAVCVLAFILVCLPERLFARVLTPPYFNLAHGRNITATATCGVPVSELYCRLTGTTGSTSPYSGDHVDSRELIQGQICNLCNPSNPEQDHQPQYATDGTERWWQSPPLSRGNEYNQVNLTISLGQEFHIAYVYIRMANSPRPGVWVLERSTDFGKTFQPWEYFADTPSDCINFFNTKADEKLVSDNQVRCTTKFSKVVPLSNGEIVVSMINDRPSAANFSYATELQEWTKATDVQLRLLRTKTLLGHLMAVARQDPTVTRRYYYSIKDISIGGRCVCNGHAASCDTRDPVTSNLMCNCVHNTCGAQCEVCCPGYTQKRWRRRAANEPFVCEPCECYGHSDECIFDEEVERNRLSIDIHGKYDGGGVCQNCRDNTMGINCEQCVPGYYRPYDVPRDAKDACVPCECDLRVSTGECEEGSGRCLCRPEYAGVECDQCSFGYYGYPDCIPCDCNINGTEGSQCYVATGNCPCKSNFDGPKCDQCALGFYNFPECKPCACDPTGSLGTVCDRETGQCECSNNYGGLVCDQCADGFFNFPECTYCDCDPSGTEEEICDKGSGVCLCKMNYAGTRCDQCAPGYFNFPQCQDCECGDVGSLSPVCAQDGQCPCEVNYGGRTCRRCAPGFFRYPDCTPCNCDTYGSLGQSCDEITGQCYCRSNFVGVQCEKCGENLYNYPNCEECNCNPNGAKEIAGFPLGGCGIVTSGLLCECKDRVMGRICDVCKPGYWNLNRNNPDGCEECGCHKPGTLSGVNRCDMVSGQCVCKPDVGGQDCDQCLDGFFDLDENNPFGCVDCNCDRGGSQRLTCDKKTGQCVCKQRITGQRCDTPLSGYFVPTLHQFKYEVEDGVTPERARIRYGYDERVFPGFSWRGYAILTSVQPEVQMDIDIRRPSLYQIIYRYVNLEDTAIGKVQLMPESPTYAFQEGELNLLPSRSPKFTTVTKAFVLNPGRWTLSTIVPSNVFLDYFVLIPQAYYEASQIQQRVTNPCPYPDDGKLCMDFTHPDMTGFPFTYGIDGYVVTDDGATEPVQGYPDDGLVTELEVPGLAYINENQRTFLIDLMVPMPGDYLIVVSYHNPLATSQELDIDVVSGAGSKNANVVLASCPYSSLCRQVLKGDNGLEAVFNISTGRATLYITGGDDVQLAIAAVYGIPINKWNSDYILPRIICIKLNGECVPSTYGFPVGTVRVEFEQDPNKDLQATVLPPGILDPSVGLINLNDTVVNEEQTNCPISESEEKVDCVTEVVSTYAIPIEIRLTVIKPGQYVLLVQYYMPGLVDRVIPVRIYVDGQVITGTFNPKFCANNVGCRGTITFDQGNGNIVKLGGTDIQVVINGTRGDEIWLDYLLVVPVDQYDKSYLVVQPIDKSGDFLSMCVDEGFQLKTNDEFCKDASFTLTTSFNNGALDCNCNPDGSLSFTCDPFGGQCQCRDYVIGRTCSACRPDFYGFPNCKPCNCPFGLCEEVTGKCICPPLVEGDQCERCEPEAYGYDRLIGCQGCNCDVNGVLDRDLNCDQTTGQCSCKPNVDGRRCDTCLAGYHTFPYCEDCGCDIRGTLAGICDQVTSDCLCKDNVVGESCDQCAQGTYSLTSENPKGCLSCFCFGHTSRCDSSQLTWGQVNEMDGWLATNPGDEEVEKGGSTIRLSSDDGVLDESDNPIYWLAPPAYLGKMLKAYGGNLQYKVLFTLPRDIDSEGRIAPDIILSGNNMSVVYYHKSQPVPSTAFNVAVPLLEYNFIHENTRAPVSKDQFMMILYDLKGLLIRASYYSRVGEIRLSDVVIDVASEVGVGDQAISVEVCECPPNYIGLSCENCAPGYYRPASASLRDICVKCNCNGHSEDCDVETGECFNCRDNTTGPNCEQCLAGYYGDPATGGCQICACPIPVPSNNFATTCTVTEDGYTASCSCLPGYTGVLCDICDAGYYGDPREEGNFCQPCSCSGNIDLDDPNSCDRSSGACLLCENYSGGPNCGECRDWYWGDAVINKDCQRCECDRCGSESCDKMFGTCQCKPNVEGINCDKCKPNTWGSEYCTGCRDCECGDGSVSQQCDLYSGRCECQPGVEGNKCDRCMPGHWNYGPSGCQPCNCLSDGSVGCDPETGRCQCLRGVTGDQCDRCLPRWVLVPNRGCTECDYCIHLLLDDMDFLERNVSVISRQMSEVSVGVGAFNKLSLYNESVEMLRPQVEALYEFDTDQYQAMIDPVADEVSDVTEEAKSMLTQSDSFIFTSELLVENGVMLNKNISDTQRMIDELNLLAQETLRFINQVREQILDSDRIRNLDQYFSQGQRILNEIMERNFGAENQTSQEEYDNVLTVMSDIMAMQELIQESMNQSSSAAIEIDDIRSRLYDLNNSSRYSSYDADKALEIIQRLRAVQVEIINKNMEDFNMAAKDREENLKGAGNDVTESQAMLNMVIDNFDDIASKSSSMDEALSSLEDAVNDRVESIDELQDMTNRTLLHAKDLKTAAEGLDSLYEDTRSLSGNAVKAGQAYKTILDAVEQAQNSSDKALLDAETARDESIGIGTNVSIALAEYLVSVQTAQKLYDHTQTELQTKYYEATEDLIVAKDLNSEVENDYANLKASLESLIADDQTQDKVNSIQVTADAAQAKVVEALALSEPILDEQDNDETKINEIITKTPSILEDMRQIEAAASQTEKNQPEVESLLKEVAATAERVMEKGRDLEVNVVNLKEKIARARDEANRIRVGLKLLGNTTVTLRNPANLEDSGSYSKVSAFFKTTQSNALVLYAGNNQNTEDSNNTRKKRSVDVVDTQMDEVDELLSRNVRQASEYRSDYIALEIRDGRVVFTFDLGSGPARIISSLNVDDGNWHQIIAQRVGKTGTLTVKSQNEDDDVQVGTSEGTSAVLELNPATTLFLVGGVPEDVVYWYPVEPVKLILFMEDIPRELTTENFVGGMEDLRFDEEPLGLWNFRDGDNNNQGQDQRDFLKEVFMEGVRFNGMGYAVLSRDSLRLKPDRTRMSMYFKTFSEDGLLFYMGQKDYFSIEMRGGKVIFQYDLGGGAAIMETSDTYNDGKWHKIAIDRDQRSAILIMDQRVEEIQSEARGNLNNLETTDDVYFGGIDNVLIPSLEVTTAGFDGCLKDIVVDTTSVDPFENKRSKGIIRGCTAKVTHLVSFPSSRMGYFGLEPVNIGSMFDVTFKMKTMANNALLMFAADSSQTNVFSVSVSDGRIIVSESLGSLSSQLTSQVDTYGDGEWHYISIMKMGKVLTMNIDDTHIVESQKGVDELITDSPLYFGGLPSDYVVTSDAVPTPQGIEGCMGDITVNKKFQNLAHVFERSGIRLGDCVTDIKIVEPMKPTETPDQCALPPVLSTAEDENAVTEGVRFGAIPDSREEYEELPVGIKFRPVRFSVTFKTTSDNGVIFYTVDENHVDFMGLFLLNGQVAFGFNCGTGAAHIISKKAYNDGQWHTVKFYRRRKVGTLTIDGELVGSGESKGPTLSINTDKPHYVGGLPEDMRKKAIGNLGDGAVGFKGCMKDISLNMIAMGEPSKVIGTQSCSSGVESGTFFGQDGGFVQLFDNFKVGREMEISMDIRPRSQEGVILAVHGKTDYLLLQLSEGNIVFSTNNGAGDIVITYSPPTKNAVCDGRWHSIRAFKKRHILELIVDGVRMEPVEGDKPEVSAADTNDPLFIGGIENPEVKGVITSKNYVGCIRNVRLNGNLQYIATGSPSGDVRLDACPIN